MNEPKIDLTGLYTLRLVLFMESGPQSNKYMQILLSPEQFKKMSLYLSREVFDKDPNHNCNNPHCLGNGPLVSDKHVINLPDDIVDIHRCIGPCDC